MWWVDRRQALRRTIHCPVAAGVSQLGRKAGGCKRLATRFAAVLGGPAAAARPPRDAYVAGQPAVYYEEGNSSAVVAPEVVPVWRAPQGTGPRGGEPYLDISIVCDANNVEELWAPDWVGYLTTLRDKLVVYYEEGKRRGGFPRTVILSKIRGGGTDQVQWIPISSWRPHGTSFASASTTAICQHHLRRG